MSSDRTWWTAKEALMPAPLTSLPCWYNLLTEGPIPCKADMVLFADLKQ